jgi:hypothetical protein
MAGLATVLVMACSLEHNVRFQPHALRLALSKSANKRIAVILPAPEVRPLYELKYGLHTYRFADAPKSMAESLQESLRAYVQRVEVHDQAVPPGFDGYVHAKLDVAFTSGLLISCSVSVTLTLNDARGGVIATRTSTVEQSFPPSSSAADYEATQACNGALRAAAQSVSEVVLNRIDDL